MSIRVECTTPGLEHCYIEVSERWTRGDIAALFDAGKAADVFQRRVTSCLLELADGATLTDVALVYDDNGALHPDLDFRLLNFVPEAVILAVNEVASLGKSNARLLSGGTERANPTPLATMTETTQAT